jgi:sialate O-acetylesterase
MLKQIAPYAVKGVIWYQGEADDEKAELYHRMFPSLIRCWRELWDDDFPFLFVQLAPFRHWMSCTGARYPELRAAQQWTADNVMNTAMAVITDAGCDWDIHPKNKRPVGERLALLAEHYVYGDDILCEAPRMCGISVNDSQITLEFDFAGDGLRLRGDRLNSLEIYQGGYPIAYTSCKAEGNTVTVYGDEIQAGMPTEARIACTDFYEVNVFNSAGIPARPAIVTTSVSPLDAKSGVRFLFSKPW